jgi:hypothetical protein
MNYITRARLSQLQLGYMVEVVWKENVENSPRRRIYHQTIAVSGCRERENFSVSHRSSSSLYSVSMLSTMC